MSRERTKDMNYDELIKFRITGAAYAAPLLAETELQIRLIEALNASTAASTNLNKKMYWLNWIIGVFAAISTALTFSIWLNPNWEGLMNILGKN